MKEANEDRLLLPELLELELFRDGDGRGEREPSLIDPAFTDRGESTGFGLNNDVKRLLAILKIQFAVFHDFKIGKI